jgi:hypothetical protein
MQFFTRKSDHLLNPGDLEGKTRRIATIEQDINVKLSQVLSWVLFVFHLRHH